MAAKTRHTLVHAVGQEEDDFITNDDSELSDDESDDRESDENYNGRDRVAGKSAAAWLSATESESAKSSVTVDCGNRVYSDRVMSSDSSNGKPQGRPLNVNTLDDIGAELINDDEVVSSSMCMPAIS